MHFGCAPHLRLHFIVEQGNKGLLNENGHSSRKIDKFETAKLLPRVFFSVRCILFTESPAKCVYLFILGKIRLRF